ncbi:hypothetical protein HPC38_01740 [Pasteurellaceae bacterium HPA106]|uniref:BRCT domain-containing protein n=1 Tax=Spirabiliibacterium pneumoniae TaxID=221400 RepID=UPI001AAC99D4|nr:BRCT domain-containing protein [Spirabiliibacterium pneumoniae]MBE2895598.1 hypothetical protein [Spirabiliibacterium pneumoniae]
MAKRFNQDADYPLEHVKYSMNLIALINALSCDGEVNRNEILYLNTWILNTLESYFYGRIPDQITSDLLAITDNLLNSQLDDKEITVKAIGYFKTITDQLNDFIHNYAHQHFYYHEACVNFLQGACIGFLADNKINDRELEYLESLLATYEVLREDPICSKFYDVVIDLKEIDDVSEKEKLKNHLMELIKDFSGSSDDIIEGMALGKSFFDYVENVNLDGKVVCFTGKFKYGTRKKCQQLAIAQGAIVIDDWRSDLDYIIVGTFSARGWMYTTYGRKVEIARTYQKERNHPVKIISESQWDIPQEN